MKTLIFALALLSSTQAHAWTKIVECNNGELVVDQGANDSLGRPTYQLVLRGQPLSHFVEAGAVAAGDVNAKGEFITSLNTYDGQLLGMRPFRTAPNGMQLFRNYRVSRHFGDVTLRASIGNRFMGEEEKANWEFHNCR